MIFSHTQNSLSCTVEFKFSNLFEMDAVTPNSFKKIA